MEVFTQHKFDTMDCSLWIHQVLRDDLNVLLYALPNNIQNKVQKPLVSM